MSDAAPAVSVIVPARNAGATIEDTLASLEAQTLATWEAIVIDDASTDSTAAIVERRAAGDRRVRLVSGAGAGVDVARNLGLSHARGDSVLFLDSDDWLEPRAFELLRAGRSQADLVIAGSRHVTSQGDHLADVRPRAAASMFEELARRPPFVIHSCLAARVLIEEVGGFDPSVGICADWDLWQRAARTGARFHVIDDVLAITRVQAGSVSSDLDAFLVSGLGVIERGHSSDPRVLRPAPRWARGADPAVVPHAKLGLTAWLAGFAIGRGENPLGLLEIVDTDDPGLDPRDVAMSLVHAVPLAGGHPPEVWTDLWERLGEQVDALLAGLERRSGAPELAARTRQELERRAVEAAAPVGAATVGKTCGVRVDLERPLADLAAPGMERILLWPEFAGRRLGTVELPVCDGVVSADVIADAVAARHFWELLGDWFRSAVYPGRGLAGEHDEIGWEVFLQELWGLPDWSNQRFYELGEPGEIAADARPLRQLAARRKGGWVTVEAAEDLPSLTVGGESRDVVVTVGGAPLGVLRLKGPAEFDPDALRALITTRGGLELCRHAVREGILGRSPGGSLRERLCERARERRPKRPRERGFDVAPVAPRAGTTALGRHAGAPVGTSASRRGALPSAALADLQAAARAAGEPVLEGGGRVEYVPELVWRTRDQPPAGLLQQAPEHATPTVGRPYDRHRFESTFAAREDPWDYGGAYEQSKYEQTLSLLPQGQIERALELACAEGHFTVQLAPRVGELIAADVSSVALRRAHARCAELTNVFFRELDMVSDDLPSELDLIVCSEVLYYAGDRASLDSVASKIAGALKPGGHLVTLHGRVVQDEPGVPAFDWGLPFGSKTITDALEAPGGLTLVEELRAPLYRVQRFQRPPAVGAPPRVTEIELPPGIAPSVLAGVRWDGTASPDSAVESEVSTSRLLILMYHRIADAGGEPRFRVPPQAFAEQLDYLRGAGFSSATPDDWRRAMESRRPLPGRRVLITFDDGYADFATHAWPLLQEHGFGALVFVVAGQVGGSNRWDGPGAEQFPLMSGEELRRLRDEGLEIGSHSVSHPFMTTLSPADVTREAARSRSILTSALGAPPLAFAYPYGDQNGAVRQLIGACGYAYAFSARPHPSRYVDDLLELPRIEITGEYGLEDFVARLSGADVSLAIES